VWVGVASAVVVVALSDALDFCDGGVSRTLREVSCRRHLS